MSMRLYLVIVSFFSIALYAADAAYFFIPKKDTICCNHMHGCEVFEQKNAHLIWAVAAQDESVAWYIAHQLKNAFNEALQQDEIVVPSFLRLTSLHQHRCNKKEHTHDAIRAYAAWVYLDEKGALVQQFRSRMKCITLTQPRPLQETCVELNSLVTPSNAVQQCAKEGDYQEAARIFFEQSPKIGSQTPEGLLCINAAYIP